MILNEEYIVKIEKMINEGKALARINSLPIFIDNGCPDDVLKIKIAKINKRYAIGEIMEILESSPYRITPECSMHKVCGSCNWQHISYDCQLKQKQNIVFETIKNITGKEFHVNETIPSPKTSQYRCKIQVPVTEKKSRRLISGYYKKNSHELVNIKYCPMQNPLVNEIIEFIKEEAQKLGISGYIEKKHTGLLRHIVLRQSSKCDEILIILVINDNKISTNLKKLAQIIKDKFSMIVGVCANFNNNKTNVILGRETEVIVGQSSYNESLSEKVYSISANSFFQVNPLCAEVIFNIAKKLIDERIQSPTILDAYSGVSSFGIWLSDIASKVVCIEEVVSASNDAIKNVELNNCNNVEIINGDAGNKFKELIDSNVKFDVTLIDPPRKGCDDNAINNVISLTGKYLIYISCNVSTLARDMKILMENGFSPEYIQPVDMFPHTYHVETVVLFKKQ